MEVDRTKTRRLNLRRVRVVFSILSASLFLVGLAPYWLIARSLRSHSDAIVMLSGSSAYIERAQWAARLWHYGRAPKIILTNDGQSAGWDEERERNPLFYERAMDELQRHGVPAYAIDVIPQIVTSTHDEAVMAHEYAERQKLKSLQIVTSPYHTRRALWTFQRVFANSNIELGIDAPPTGQQSPHPLLWWTSPLGWKMVCGEYLKFICYRARY